MFLKTISHHIRSSSKRTILGKPSIYTPFVVSPPFPSRLKSSLTNVNRAYRTSALPVFPSKGLKEAFRCNPDDFTTFDICKFINSIEISFGDKSFLSLALTSRKDLTPQLLETAIRGLMYSRLFNDVIHLFRMTMANFPSFSFSTDSLELVLQAVLVSKNYPVVDQVWNACDNRARNRCGIWSVYCRILLADRRMHDARPLLDKNQHQAYSNPSANCEILQGLYTGKYYEDCVNFYKGLLRLDSSGRSLGEATSYHAALKAAYQICDYRQSLQIYETMEKTGIKMSRPVIYIVAEIFEKGDFWRIDYEEKMSILRENGIIPTEQQQLQLLAQSRLSQFIKGSEILQRFSKEKNESVMSVNEQGNYYVSLEKYYDPHRRLRLIGVMNEIAEMKGKKGKRLIVKSIRNDSPLKKLLECELFPSIEYTCDNTILRIPVPSILHWAHHREDPVV